MNPSECNLYANHPKKRRNGYYINGQSQTREGGASGGVEGSEGGKRRFTRSCRSAFVVTGGGVEGGAGGAFEGIGRNVVEGSDDGKQKLTNSGGSAFEVSGGGVEGGEGGAGEGISQNAVERSGYGKRRFTRSARIAAGLTGGVAKEGASGELKGIGRIAVERRGYGNRKHTMNGRSVVVVRGGGDKGGVVGGNDQSAVNRSGNGKQNLTKSDRIVIEISDDEVGADVIGDGQGIGRNEVIESGDGKPNITKRGRSEIGVSGVGVQEGESGVVGVSGLGVTEGASGLVDGKGGSVVAGNGDGKRKLTKSGNNVVEISSGAVEGGAGGAFEGSGDGNRKLIRSGRCTVEVNGGGVEGGASGAFEGIGQSAIEESDDARQPLTMKDAYIYLKEVKAVFVEQMEIYHILIDILSSFITQRVDIDEVQRVVKDMFQDHPNLIVGFNAFLPKRFEIPITNKETTPEKKPIVLEDAVTFLSKIKEHFGVDHHLYQSFVDMVFISKRIQRTSIEVYQEVAILFQAHPDFVEEFKKSFRR